MATSFCSIFSISTCKCIFCYECEDGKKRYVSYESSDEHFIVGRADTSLFEQGNQYLEDMRKGNTDLLLTKV